MPIGQHRRSGREALAAGIEAGQKARYQEALTHFDEALEWAQKQGDRELWDRAYSNRCSAAFELGDVELRLPELREIVLRSADPETVVIASQAVSRAYELRGDLERALFYCRISRDRCVKLTQPRPFWLAITYLQLGNLLLLQSHFDEACESYEMALKLIPIESSVTRATLLDNLGYGRLVQGRYQEGFALLFESLRTLVRLSAEMHMARPLVSLCFGYLELGKTRSALRHCRRALRLTEKYSDSSTMKYALYLLGDSYQQQGQEKEARECFVRLQQTYYPDASHVPELLMAIDFRSMINLKG